MTDKDRVGLRAALLEGLSLPDLIDQLDSRRYADLVDQHVRTAGDNLPAAIDLHEQLMLPVEVDAGARAILGRVLAVADSSAFWELTAGDILNTLSCDLNDALFPEAADDAGIFNLFQLLSLMLANHARLDSSFRALMLSAPSARQRSKDRSGSVTKLLGIAINDFDACRIRRKALLAIFQDAIDNGDILEPANQMFVVTHVLPLIDSGQLQKSKFVDRFEEQMDALARDLPVEQSVRARRSWWRFWK